jgi:putative ABC transport system ATP-binding protein
MVSLIRAILLDPQILLLDEPTAALDSDAKLRFEERILKWHRESNAGNEDGRAFLWTSHDPNQVDRLTDQTLTMQQGELILPTGPNSENQSANKSNQQANGVG